MNEAQKAALEFIRNGGSYVRDGDSAINHYEALAELAVMEYPTADDPCELNRTELIERESRLRQAILHAVEAKNCEPPEHTDVDSFWLGHLAATIAVTKVLAEDEAEHLRRKKYGKA